ncbi:hypothetical protein GO495_06420 [Chitinophaga oryziterrae]|uniref:RloB domain-containing protein n=1 Tax=Chitinophaga oryziterrae TaxID=1031224 RepID=A0A6N8J6H2_9BACT|nr:RloB family protein [Chitinophaga oryziterrae]MVT40208.1 hypothetical protein [Chitinophaga oryziterrae]
MTKNKSKEKSDFKGFLENLTASKPTVPAVGTKPDKQYFLVVSQGTETEILYFKYLASLLPPKIVSIETKGHSKDTIAVVRKAVELRELRQKNTHMPNYNEVWALFDKDDFTDKDYEIAISFANKEGIESGHSNECFELWYLLHFADLESAIGRKVYFERLSKLLNTNYSKSEPTVCERIHKEGDVKRAIVRGKRLEALHNGKNAAAASPYTRIYILVERLLKYLENTKN